MAGKKTKENISKYDKKHLRRLAAYQKQIDAIFDTAAKEAAAIGAAVDPSGTEPFSFADHPLTRKRLDKLLQTLADKVEAVVVNGINAEWDLADEKNNELVKSAFGSDVSQWPQEQRDRYFTSHADARAAFLARKVSGLNLSERVWNYAERFKDEIELGLDLGISEGKSATSMARELKQYLRHPDMLFRRVRDKYGVLHLSKRAKAYHPGRGVYRSSYKNALRLAATETNIAYHTADYERWQSLDFVVGIEISLSNNHTILDSKGNPQPFYDICDELAGKYPKGFKFTGWHPFCRCHAVPVLMTEKELMDGNDRIMQGKEPNPESVNEVKEMPKAFNEWVERNADRIKAAQERGTEAYFIKDNAQYIGASEQVKKGSANAAKLGRAAEKESRAMLLSHTENTNFTQEQIENFADITKATGYIRNKPMSFDEADNGKANVSRDRNNCAACVVAHELRLRGYNITAAPYNSNKESISHNLARDTRIAWLNNNGTIPEFTAELGGTEREIISKLEKLTRPIGSRYHLGWDYSSTDGHIITLERTKQGLVLYDPQRNTFASIGEILYEKMDGTKLQLLRVDRLLINPYLLNALTSTLE